MIDLEKFTNAELIQLSQDISFAIDMSGNEENYTILDDIENTLEVRDCIAHGMLPANYEDYGS